MCGLLRRRPLQRGILRGSSGVIVGEVYDGGGRGGGAGGLGGGVRPSAWRGLRAARGAPGEAGEVGGGEERGPEDVAWGGAPRGLAGDERGAVKQAPEIPGRHGKGRREGGGGPEAWKVPGPRRELGCVEAAGAARHGPRLRLVLAPREYHFMGFRLRG